MGRAAAASRALQVLFVLVCFVSVELLHAADSSTVVGGDGVELQKDDEKFCAPPSSPSSPSYTSPTYSPSPTYSSPSPSYSSPAYSSPSPSSSSSSPVTSSPTSPSYSSPTYSSPSPTYSSPVYSGPSPYYSPSPSSGSSPVVYAPVSSPSTPYPTTPSSPDCPPLASWFTSPSSGSSSWWDDQLAAENHKELKSTDSNNAAAAAAGVKEEENKEATADEYGEKKLTIPGFLPSPPPPSPPLIPASGPYSGAPETSPAPGTCEYWSSNNSDIPGFLEGALVNLLQLLGINLGALPFSTTTTLVEALNNRRTDAYGALMRQGSAALINSYHFANYAYTPQEVREGFNGALFSEQAAAVQAVKFENANHGVYVRAAAP
jgi:hypothetical protein